MHIEFNPDGSIKVPAQLAKAKADVELKMRAGRCILLRKEIMSSRAPKSCVLHLTLSDRMAGDKIVEKIHAYYLRERSETPTKIRQVNDKEWVVEVGSAFRRCSDCNGFIARLKEFMDQNVILERGNCSYEQHAPGFSYEDHFG